MTPVRRKRRFNCSLLVGGGLLWFSSSLIYAQNRDDSFSLDALLKTMNQSYPKIIASRLQIAQAQGDYLSALGQFDPSIKTNTRSQPEGGYITNYADNELSVPTLANGLRLFAGYRIGRGNYPVYYQNYLTNSGGEYRAGLALPLLKDFFIDKQRTALLTQAETITLKTHELAATKLLVYQEAIKAYWQWVQTGLQRRTLKHLLELAIKRQKAIVKQANQGDLATLAVAENQQTILQRQQLLNQGEMAFAQAAVNLSIYYRDLKGNPMMPSPHQLPSQLISDAFLPIKDKESIATRLGQHPALRKLKTYYHMIKLKQNLAKNDLLPQLDATAYTSKQTGTGASPILLPQAALVGVRFKFPLYQREAKGKIISSTNELRQIVVERKLVFEQLKNQLANLFIALRTYKLQISLLNKELALAQRVEDGEVKKFFIGDSTLFLVNQREQTTTQVRLSLINSKVNLLQTKSLVRYFLSTEVSPH